MQKKGFCSLMLPKKSFGYLYHYLQKYEELKAFI